METILKNFFKFMVLIIAIACSIVGNVEGLPPCCPDGSVECQPIVCKKPPCCKPPSSDMNP